MGIVGALALAANVGCALMLYFHRDGDANRQSVWICSRNDAIANIAVLAAALGVFGTGTGWPDIIGRRYYGGLIGFRRHSDHPPVADQNFSSVPAIGRGGRSGSDQFA